MKINKKGNSYRDRKQQKQITKKIDQITTKVDSYIRSDNVINLIDS